MKKGFIALTVLVLTVSMIFSGCSGNIKTATNQEKNNTAAGQEQAKDSQKQEDTNKGTSNGEESISNILAKAKKIEGMTFECNIKEKGKTVKGKMWAQGKKFKLEYEDEGNKAVIYADGDNNTAYTYMPAQNMAMKIPMDNFVQELVDSPVNYASKFNNSKVIETTTYQNQKCKVISVENFGAKGNIKAWISEELGIPLKVENGDAQGGVVIEYTNLKAGSLPAETFKLPEGVKIVDMGDMMQ